MFSKILQNNPDTCRELLELLLDKKIHKISYPEGEKQDRITYDAKSVRFDVYVEDDKSSVYDVEMQVMERSDLPKRCRYYHGMLDLNLIQRGAKYSELKESYVIFICKYDLERKDTVYFISEPM